MTARNTRQEPIASSHMQVKMMIVAIREFLRVRSAATRLIWNSIGRSEGAQLPTPWCTQYRLDKRTPRSSARQHMRRLLAFLCVLLACGVLIGNRTTNAQQPLLNLEYEIKAGYFAYFGGYVKWPNPPFAGADNEFVIGILGNNPFGQYLLATGNGFAIDTSRFKTPVKAIQRKSIKIVEYNSVNAFQNNYSPCHILFISRSSAPGVPAETIQNRVNAALQKTKGQPVLLVADASNMDESRRLASSGVIICYWNDRQANQVRMTINRQAEKGAQLSILAPLLRLSIVSVL
jgi:hypothetical protein